MHGFDEVKGAFMKCPECNAEVSINAEEAAHDPNMIDVVVTCDDCDWKGYTFISQSDLCTD